MSSHSEDVSGLCLQTDKVVTDTRQALLAYEGARLGTLGISDPSSILNEAANRVRAKFGKQAPTATTTEQAPAKTAIQQRQEAKRGLTPQPTRAAAPMPTVPRTNGQSESRRSSVVQNMIAQRMGRKAA